MNVDITVSAHGQSDIVFIKKTNMKRYNSTIKY